MMTEAELHQQFITELAELSRRVEHLIIDVTPLEAWALLSLAQFALRHPALAGSPTAAEGRPAVERLAVRLTPTPALAEVARRGWVPR